MPHGPLVSAIVGNGRMLGNLNQSGELTQLYWPHIDYPNLIARVAAGVHIWGREGVTWLADQGWTHQQRYIGDGPIVETCSECVGLGLMVVQTDFIPPGQDALVRRFRVHNTGMHSLSITFLYYIALHIEESARYNTILWEPEAGCLVTYRRDIWVAVGGSRSPRGYRVGPRPYDHSAWNDAQDGWLSGGMMEMNDVDGAMSWESGAIEPGNAWQLTIFTSCSKNRNGVLAALAAARGQGAGNLEKMTELAWSDWLKQTGAQHHTLTPPKFDTCQSFFEFAEDLVDRTGTTQPSNFTNGIYEQLWMRSLVTLRLLTDETGAMIAAPEFDPDRRWCGGYGYCWGRDAAYMVYALDVAGCHDMTADFYRWTARVQEPEGVWYQRYWVTGEVAPSWGFIQIDETGSILWGLWQHIAMTQNRDLLQELWPTIERAAGFLVQYRDAETGLVDVSWDLWEERYGLHTYSNAAVWGGLQGAAQLASMLGHEDQAQQWLASAAALKEAVLKHCWSPLHNRFLRCIKQRVPEWLKHDPEHQHRVQELPPPAGCFYPEYMVAEDATVDASLLGLVTPFGMLPADDARVVATVAVIERDLTQSPAGGVVRYPGDHYRGGNPWIICTLWLAQYYNHLGEKARAVQLLNWAVDHRTSLDLLPEQVDRNTGEPAWVVPLAWSHAMYMLTVAGLGPKL